MVEVTPAPAASPPDAIAAAITAATTKFFTNGTGFSRGVYTDVSATDAIIVALTNKKGKREREGERERPRETDRGRDREERNNVRCGGCTAEGVRMETRTA